MHRNRTWQIDPEELRTQRNRILPIEGGDGSTLSLDFTGGVLDPRLTFTRSTNATFINSQGYVQYANANIMRQSENCGSWSGVQNITPTADAAVAPNGTQTADQLNLAATNYRYQATANTNAVSQPYVASIWMRTVSGTASVGFRIANSVTGANSVIATCSVTETWQRFNTPAFTLTDTANRVIDAGIDQRSIVSGPNVAANIYVWGLQVQPGTSVGEYLPTTTTEEFDTPRFDYDPTTLTPRGLLIEGSASNYGTYSESFATSGSGTLWTYSAITKNATLASSPAGNNDAAQFNETTANDIHRISQFVGAAAGSVTISVWAKAIDPATPRRLFMNALGFMGCGALFDLDPAVQTGASGNAVNVAGSAANRAGTWVKYPNGWYRCSIVGTYNTVAQTLYLQVNRASSTVATDDTYSGSTANGLMLYGFQTELGSGASSYIPTGASTGNRAFDYCEMGNIAALNYSTTNGSMLYEGQFSQFRATSFATMRTAFCTASGAIEAFGAFAYGATMYPTAQDATGNTALATITPAMTINTNFRAAWSLNASLASGEVRGCINGGSVTASGSTSMSATATPTILTIGGRPSYGLYYPCGTIKRVKYWPITLSDATLQSITT
jgi:hypothetical protein